MFELHTHTPRGANRPINRIDGTFRTVRTGRLKIHLSTSRLSGISAAIGSCSKLRPVVANRKPELFVE